MTRFRAMSSIAICGVGVVLLLVSSQVGADRSASEDRAAVGEAATSSSTTESVRGGETRESAAPRLRAKSRCKDGRFPYAVQFVGSDGEIAGELDTVPYDRETGIFLLLMSRNEKYIAAVERTGREPAGPKFVVRYYGVHGHELWRTRLCCDLGTGLHRQIRIAEDGSTIVLVDVEEGVGCLYGEDGYPAPQGCAGLRVFTAKGEETFRTSSRGDTAQVSPRGRYVLFGDREGSFLLSVRNNELIGLPLTPEGLSPKRVRDDGTVFYFWGEGKEAPETPQYEFVPGKGLGKVGDGPSE